MTLREKPPADDRSGRTYRVVELSEGFAAQVCGRLFAGFGHTVLRCEPIGGDPMRAQEPVDGHERGHAFAAMNADKGSIEIDFDDGWAPERIAELVAAADIVIMDFGPGKAARFDLSAEKLRARYPYLVVVSLTPYGCDDSRSDRHGDSLLAESYGGLAEMIGEPDGAPLSLGGEQTAHAAAFAGFYGAMLAWRMPRGDTVDVALCDVAAYMDWKSDITYAHTNMPPRRTGASKGLWRILRAADGWVGVIFQPEHWDALIGLVANPRLRDERLRSEQGRSQFAEQWWPVIQEWASSRTKRDIYQAAQEAGLPFGYCADIADIVADPQYRSRGFIPGVLGTDRESQPIGPPFLSDELPWRHGPPPEINADGDASGPWLVDPAARTGERHERGDDVGPLSGVVVLDLGTITAGAATGRLLADYGATVIKVESPARPDPFRVWPTVDIGSADGHSDGSPLFESNNAGKLGITLDLKSSDGPDTFSQLVAGADVLIENFTVGVTERLGVDHETVRKINPNLIYLSLSSQGQTGPDASSRSYGSTLDLLSGLASITGYESGTPLWSSADVNYPDQLVSLFAAGLITYCLNHGDFGVYLDVSQRELVTWTFADRITEYIATGSVAAPTGNRRPGAEPHGVYTCYDDDEWIAITCRTSGERAELARLVGQPLPENASEAWWRENRALVDTAITGWTGARSKATCEKELTRHGITSARVLSARERAQEPHFHRRRVFLDGPPRLKGFPLQLKRYMPPHPRPAPTVGQHNNGILNSDWTGLERPASGPLAERLPHTREDQSR